MYQSSWRSPSNIALVKYWGKRGLQLPRNPSLSFTLSACHTDMHMKVTFEDTAPGIRVLYEGQPRPAFIPKIQSFFSHLVDRFPWLGEATVEIDSVNTFPHGAGIASSASAMSAMALCLQTIDDQIKGMDDALNVGADSYPPLHSRHHPYELSPSETNWLQLVSTIARLGSGSACRSIYPGAALWGKTGSVPDSSDEYALPWKNNLAPFFQDYQDTILIVSASEKSVSSTAGHALMNSLAYAETRYAEAGKNMQRLINCMKRDDGLDEFISICESEALQLHALMMSGPTPFILMEPNTIAIIKEIWRFRKETSIPACFTLDAGPNVHLLYPSSYKSSVLTWIRDVLVPFCSEGRFIQDEVGAGPMRISPLAP